VKPERVLQMIKTTKKQSLMIDSIEVENGLIDDCKYMVYLKDGFEHECFGNSFPIKNQKEFNEFMKEIVEV